MRQGSCAVKTNAEDKEAGSCGLTAVLDPQRLERFAGLIRRHLRNRIDGETLWRMFAAAFPVRPQGAEERRWFLDALMGLARQEVIRLPPARSPRWDRSLGLAVPGSVDRVMAPMTAKDTSWRLFPWHPALQWIADLPQISEQQIVFLHRVHGAMVGGWLEKPAPLKYRSLQLTGHEKGLARLMSTHLFGPGRLSLELLGCVREAVPLAWESVSEHPSMLVFENAGPFWVARQTLGRMSDPPYGMVGYGGGKSFQASLQHLLTIGRPLKSIHYVGDMDASGLKIAEAARHAAGRIDLPQILPAPGFHLAMLEAAGRFGYPKGWPAGSGGDPIEGDGGFLNSFSRDLRKRILAIVNSGRRIPEEVLGPDEMAAVLEGGARRRA